MTKKLTIKDPCSLDERPYEGNLKADDFATVRSIVRDELKNKFKQIDYPCTGSLADNVNFLGIIGAAVYVGSQLLTLGPLDFVRTSYNRVIGDGAALKSELVDYTRTGIRHANSKLKSTDLERKLANELGMRYVEGMPVNPEHVSYATLWDASEDYARNPVHRFVTPGL